MKVQFKLLRPNAQSPVYSSASAAGADLHACVDAPVQIEPGECFMVPTGIACAIPEGYVGLICARSGMAVKRGLAPANKVGVIDSDYRGEIMVALLNHTDKAQTVGKDERVAQLLIVPYLTAEFVPAEELDSTERGAGGFGSTGK